MKPLSQKKLDELKSFYPIGSRVKLINMDDKYAPPEGTLGTIKDIDCFGDIEVAWDTGSSLKLILECDKFSLEK